MTDYTLKDYETKKEMKYQGQDAKVLELTLEDSAGATHTAEMFTMASTPLPSRGDKMQGEIEPSDYGPKWKKAGGGGTRGGFKRSPGETKAIQRQHSQEMALRYHDTLVGASNRPLNLEQIHELTNWFEADISGKQPRGITFDPMLSDVPIDTKDLVP